MTDDRKEPNEITDDELDAVAGGAGSLQSTPSTSEGKNGNAVAVEKIVIAHEGIDLVRG
jgi:hypothetical protein